MKNALFSLAAISVLVFSGCSQKNPEIDSGADVSVIDGQGSGMDSNQGADANVLSTEEKIANLKSKLGSVYFGFDSFGISSSMQPVVSGDAQVVNSADASAFTIKLEGNCDEWGSDEYNMALGLKRAQSVKSALSSQGVDVSRITTISYGKNNPVCSEKTQACWAKNRRVDFDLLP